MSGLYPGQEKRAINVPTLCVTIANDPSLEIGKLQNVVSIVPSHSETCAESMFAPFIPTNRPVMVVWEYVQTVNATNMTRHCRKVLMVTLRGLRRTPSCVRLNIKRTFTTTILVAHLTPRTLAPAACSNHCLILCFLTKFSRRRSGRAESAGFDMTWPTKNFRVAQSVASISSDMMDFQIPVPSTSCHLPVPLGLLRNRENSSLYLHLYPRKGKNRQFLKKNILRTMR